MLILIAELILLAASLALNLTGVSLGAVEYLLVCIAISFGCSYFMTIKQGWYPDYLRYLFAKSKVNNKPNNVFKGVGFDNDIEEFKYINIKDGFKDWLNVLLFCPYCITFRTFFYGGIIFSQFNSSIINIPISFFVGLAFAGLADLLFTRLPQAIKPDVVQPQISKDISKDIDDEIAMMDNYK